MNSNDKLIIQSHFSLVWWAESLLSGYFQSPLFEGMPFTDDFVHRQLRQPNEALKSLIAPSLYVALVLPRETIFKQYEDDFKEIDESISTKAKVSQNYYPPATPIPYTRHLRNATAHARISITASGIEFKDENKQKRPHLHLHAAIDFETLGGVVQQLNLLLRKHVTSLQKASA